DLLLGRSAAPGVQEPSAGEFGADVLEGGFIAAGGDAVGELDLDQLDGRGLAGEEPVLGIVAGPEDGVDGLVGVVLADVEELAGDLESRRGDDADDLELVRLVGEAAGEAVADAEALGDEELARDDDSAALLEALHRGRG